jgi:hypothetical protein
MRVNIWTAVVLAAVMCGAAMAQDASQGAPGQVARGEGRRMGPGVGGRITAIEGNNITLQTQDGSFAKVKVTSSTRIMKDRNEAKLSDFKVGDHVFAAGEQDANGVWTAQMLGGRTGGDEFQRGGGMRGGMPPKPEDNGKTYILGEITKIQGTSLTVKKPDNTEQVIAVDDDTSFHNESRESVTLADIKVGDFVHGQGAVKGGVFVPKVLNAGKAHGPRPGMMPPPAASANQDQSAPDSSEQKK